MDFGPRAAIMMSDRPSHNLDGLDIDLACRIDDVCRRFEADWREGRHPRIEDYLGDVSQEGGPALRAELEALERELRPPEETVVRPESSPPTAPKPQAPNPATIDGAVTMAPGLQSTPPIPDTSIPAVHEEATLPPRDQATVDLGASRPVQRDASSPDRVRYFGDYELLREIARGIGWSSRQGRSASGPHRPYPLDDGPGPLAVRRRARLLGDGRRPADLAVSGSESGVFRLRSDRPA